MTIYDLENQDKLLEKSKRTKKVLLPILITAIVIFSIILIALLLLIEKKIYCLFLFCLILILVYICNYVPQLCKKREQDLRKNLELCVLHSLGIKKWKYLYDIDDVVVVKSKQSVSNYSDIKYFREYSYNLQRAINVVQDKNNYCELLNQFLKNNVYKNLSVYSYIKNKIISNLKNLDSYYVVVRYTSPAGRSTYESVMKISQSRLKQFYEDKSLLMSKSEYSKYLKEHENELLKSKQSYYYNKVNHLIDIANDKKSIVVKNDHKELDQLINSLIDRNAYRISKIKNSNSEDWKILDKNISLIENSINEIIYKNKMILEYYNSNEFTEIKETCSTLMNSQKEFNEYIENKIELLSNLFGTRITRNETENDDIYNYVHPYQKCIDPFTVELSSNVFSSAENNPLEYVVKYFYNDKSKYLEQIQNLHLLVEELETLKDAKKIIDNLKQELNTYISDVPTFVMSNDEVGFYSRLGLTIIEDNILNIEYKFSYTSDSGRAHRHFTIPMTEETVIYLINSLENKLTLQSFTKEQRALMTSKLRFGILERDNYTCRICGNSTHIEPNLLLEVDHIIPISKGGITEANNLQTLCWKCNRQKGNKLL